jgi:hypothetical protein
MIMKTTDTVTVAGYLQAVAAREEAARRLFESEVTLHDAHQTGVDEWVRAAGDRLHEAVVELAAAEERLRRFGKAAKDVSQQPAGLPAAGYR